MTANTANETTPPSAVVRAFFDALKQLDLDAAGELIAERCVYRNVPLHRASGKKRVLRDLRLMAKPLKRFEVQMLNMAEQGSIVLTERIDVIAGPGFCIRIPLMGVLKVEQGQIVEWRDYVDFLSCFARLLGSLLSAPWRALRALLAVGAR